MLICMRKIIGQPLATHPMRIIHTYTSVLHADAAASREGAAHPRTHSDSIAHSRPRPTAKLRRERESRECYVLEKHISRE